MVISRDERLLDRIRPLRSHGMTTTTLDRHRGHAFSYDVTMLGYNYRMDELRAALGLVQLAKSHERNARRRELTDAYRRRLENSDTGIKIPFGTNWETCAHLLPTLLPEPRRREEIMSYLRDRGIQSSIHYPPAHRFSHYRARGRETHLPHTETFCSKELTLPLHPSLRESDIDRVVAVLQEAVAGDVAAPETGRTVVRGGVLS